MIDNVPSLAPSGQGQPARSFRARSVTGASYLIVEEDERDGPNRRLKSRYRTAYSGLPVAANDDGSFTIVDTGTRLVPVGTR